MNYWVYFNSRPVPKPADVVIFDDAHLAEQPLSSLQTLRIPDKKGAARQLYRDVCNLVIAHTDAYAGLRAMQDGMAAPGTPPELLSFCDWSAISGPVRDTIEASPFVEDDEVRWVWPAVRDHLNRCGVLIGSSGSRSGRTTRRRRSTLATAKRSSGSTSPPRSAPWTISSAVSEGTLYPPRVPDQPCRRATGERRLVLNPTRRHPFDDLAPWVGLGASDRRGWPGRLALRQPRRG